MSRQVLVPDWGDSGALYQQIEVPEPGDDGYPMAGLPEETRGRPPSPGPSPRSKPAPEHRACRSPAGPDTSPGSQNPKLAPDRPVTREGRRPARCDT